jgi:hypothetical protein
MPLRRTLAVLLVIVASAWAAARPAPPLRVLFIGNSLTESNDLPEMVEAVSRAVDGPRIVTRSVANGGFSLEDHWLGGAALAALGEQDWDFVVLQQGPSALPESRLLLRRDVALFAGAVRATGAEPAVYMVWPESWRWGVFDDVVESYRIAAADVGARLLPAGRAWQIAWSLDPTLVLYGADGFHPAPQGSLLAAIAIYEGLTGRSATEHRWDPRPRDKRSRLLPRTVPAVVFEAAARARAEAGGG